VEEGVVIMQNFTPVAAQLPSYPGTRIADIIKNGTSLSAFND
jgi:hypothetical protein